jgi:thioester reductase-like protein
VVCKTQAQSATGRVVSALENHELWPADPVVAHAWKARILALPSDLDAEKLGLDEKMFARLAASVDIIVHNGALVHNLLFATCRAVCPCRVARCKYNFGMCLGCGALLVSHTGALDDDVRSIKGRQCGRNVRVVAPRHNGTFCMCEQQTSPTRILIRVCIFVVVLVVLVVIVQVKVKPVHYVSTTSVFDTVEHKGSSRVLESDTLPTCNGLSGYPLSKWAAEKLLMAARAHGLPVAIYRPGYISGASTSGVWNTDDFLCRLLKGCVQMGVAPIVAQPGEKAEAGVDMAPVDFVAASVVKLCMQVRPVCVDTFSRVCVTSCVDAHPLRIVCARCDSLRRSANRFT